MIPNLAYGNQQWSTIQPITVILIFSLFTFPRLLKLLLSLSLFQIKLCSNSLIELRLSISHLCANNANKSIKYQLGQTMRLVLPAYRFATQSTPFQSYLSSPKLDFSLKKHPGRFSIGTEIHVPRKPLSRPMVLDFFKKHNIKSKSILVNVDPSHLIGMKRLVSLQYLNKNVYQGQSESLDSLKKQNPSDSVAIGDLAFDQDVFAITDPLFAEQAKAGSSQQNNQQTLDIIFEYYRNHLERGVERLWQEYNVPKEYLYIIQTAHNLDNTIYFCGLNAYELRQIITAYLSLTEIKVLFMDTLQYAKKAKAVQGKEFHQSAREYLWKANYTYLQPINYQLLKKLRSKIKGPCFAHAYNFQVPSSSDITLDSLKDNEPDNVKVQKNAILEVLLGRLWDQPYTNNPFPYLDETFFNQSPQDQQLVVNLYGYNLSRYSAAKEKYMK